MAETAEKTYAFPTRTQNVALKEKVAELGGKAQFDRNVGAYEIKMEGLNPAQREKLLQEIAPYTSEEAKKAWESDRRDSEIGKASIRKEARERGSAEGRETPAEEPALPKNVYKMYRTQAEKADYDKILAETGSSSVYMGSKGYFRVITLQPDKFAHYMGPEAEARFKGAAPAKGAAEDFSKSDRTASDIVRSEVLLRERKAFMASYIDRGFRLSHAERSPENYGKQLVQMRSATTAQLKAVLAETVKRYDALRVQETQLRADAAGISYEEMKAKTLAEQSATVDRDGKRVVSPEFDLMNQLARGLKAIHAEIRARAGIEPEQQDRGQDRAPQQEAQQRRQEAPSKENVGVKENADLAYLQMMQQMGRNRGRGRD